MMVSENKMRRYEEFLAQTRRSMTPKRRIVAAAAFQSAIPLEPETVFRDVARGSSELRISRATVYRTLHDLARAGLIRIRSASE